MKGRFYPLKEWPLCVVSPELAFSFFQDGNPSDSHAESKSILLENHSIPQRSSFEGNLAFAYLVLGEDCF